jgi:hypothetical protein
LAIDMGLHRFLLDDSMHEAKNAGEKEAYFFYCDKDGRLNAWIARQCQGDRSTTLKAFKESTAGMMTLQDLQKPELPIRILGIESNGCLLAWTGQGALRYSCQAGIITGRADTGSSRELQQPNADQDMRPPLFPGMRESDSFRCGGLIISRHETVAQGVYGEAFFPESLLLVRSDCTFSRTVDSQPRIAIGNSQIDNNLNLIRCLDQPLFDIPIINFIVDHRPYDKAILLIGWNRVALQTIRIEQSPNRKEPINTQAKGTVKLGNSLLDDASRSCIDGRGRIAAWRDILNPGTFYTWRREH